MKRFTTVFPACGSGNSAIEMTIEDLERHSGYQAWVDVCKIPEACQKGKKPSRLG